MGRKGKISTLSEKPRTTRPFECNHNQGFGLSSFEKPGPVRTEYDYISQQGQALRETPKGLPETLIPSAKNPNG